MLLSELRMLDASGFSTTDTTSIDTVATNLIRIRVPIAVGILCSYAASAGNVRIALLPVDSLLWANSARDVAHGGFSGYAWRDAGPAAHYHFVDGRQPTDITDTSATALADCTAATIGAPASGRYLQIAPGIDTTGARIKPRIGTPVYLYQTIRYAFANSVAIAGTTALWRTVVRTGDTEELAAPFTNTAQFRWFFKNNSGVSVVTAPTNASPNRLVDIRGFELILNGISERVAQGASAQSTAYVSTAVFFKNRVD